MFVCYLVISTFSTSCHQCCAVKCLLVLDIRERLMRCGMWRLCEAPKPKIAQGAINAANLGGSASQPLNSATSRPLSGTRHRCCYRYRVYIPGVRRKLWLFSEGALGVPSMLISGLQNYNDPMLGDHTRRYSLRHQGVLLCLLQAHCPLRQIPPLRLPILLQPAGIPSMPPILLH